MNIRKYPPTVCSGRLTKYVKRELYNILKTNENNKDFGVPAFLLGRPGFPWHRKLINYKLPVCFMGKVGKIKQGFFHRSLKEFTLIMKLNVLLRYWLLLDWLKYKKNSIISTLI